MTILVVDDDEVMRKLLREVLQKEGYHVHLAASGEEAVRAIRSHVFPVVISDIRMLELDGLTVLREVKKNSKASAVILMTGFGNMEGAIEAIKEGAFDYISKPFKMDELKTVVQRAAKQWESTRVLSASSPAAHLASADVASKGLIGKTPRIVDVYKTLAHASLSSSTVLVIGESGTGKELVARAIHDNSQRRDKKFVTASCSGLAENLLEGELFGHVHGGFTGAVHERGGLFEEAHEGTLFLDEIGEMTPGLQIKLLRAIQDGEIKPVGASQTRKVEVRVIAASHRDLEQLVKSGKFREDLYYRLKVIQVVLPPLRERMDDLPGLVGHFLARCAAKNRKTVSHVSEEAMETLRTYPWPGNIRELEHAIERAVAMTRSAVLFPEDFPAEISRRGGGTDASVTAVGTASANSLEEMERAHIVRVLQDVGFNKSKASEILGIDRATLYRKAQRYGIDLHGK